MRIARRMFRLKSRKGHDLVYTPPDFFLIGQAADHQAFCNDILHRHARIERSRRILKNHLHLTSSIRLR